MAFSIVGTPDYLAPEIIIKQGYGPEVDWWSMGAIMYEMLYGYPPFISESNNEVFNKIINWSTSLKFPIKVEVSKQAVDLMKQLLTDVEKRIGYNGAKEIKKHAFFKGIDWGNIKMLQPPFIPEVMNNQDTKYFDPFEINLFNSFYPNEAQTRKRFIKVIF